MGDTMHEVRDRGRVIRFDGELIAAATSRRPGAPRWIEFALYRTFGGSYVLSRTGHSRVRHEPACPLVRRHRLPEVEAPADSVPCGACGGGSTSDGALVRLEQPLHWAQVSTDPTAVLEALYQFDDTGARYLTRVAVALLEEAAAVDPALDAAYRVEYVT